MSTTTVRESEGIAADLSELRDRRELKATHLTEREQECERLRDAIGTAVANDEDARTLRRSLRDAEDDADGLRRAVAKLEGDIDAKSRALKDARTREARDDARATGDEFATAVSEMETAITTFLTKTFAPLDARLTEAGQRANRAESIAAGDALVGSGVVSHVWTKRRALAAFLEQVRHYHRQQERA